MPRPLSKIAPQWWDYTTLDRSLLADAAKLSHKDVQQLSRKGFQVVFYDTIEEFYLAEALEYIEAWRQATADNPVGICGPIGPTEQLPLVARLVNAMGLSLRHAHFWGMDEWVIDGKAVAPDHPPADPQIALPILKYGRDGPAWGALGQSTRTQVCRDLLDPRPIRDSQVRRPDLPPAFKDDCEELRLGRKFRPRDPVRDAKRGDRAPDYIPPRGN